MANTQDAVAKARDRITDHWFFCNRANQIINESFVDYGDAVVQMSSGQRLHGKLGVYRYYVMVGEYCVDPEAIEAVKFTDKDGAIK